MQHGYLQFEESEHVLGGRYARRAASEAGRTSDLVYVLIPATNVVSQETARGR